MLVAIGFRDQAKIIASDKVSSGFGLARMIALGVDLCYWAHAMMMRYHGEKIHAAVDMIGAAKRDSPPELQPWHIMRRVSFVETRHYGEIVEYLKAGALLRA